MRLKLFCVMMLILGLGAMGCGAPKPPIACDIDEVIPPDVLPPGFELDVCEYVRGPDDLECNPEVTLADGCTAFMSELVLWAEEQLNRLPEDVLRFIDIDRIVDRLAIICGFLNHTIQIGDIEITLADLATCQPILE